MNKTEIQDAFFFFLSSHATLFLRQLIGIIRFQFYPLSANTARYSHSKFFSSWQIFLVYILWKKFLLLLLMKNIGWLSFLSIPKLFYYLDVLLTSIYSNLMRTDFSCLLCFYLSFKQMLQLHLLSKEFNINKCKHFLYIIICQDYHLWSDITNNKVCFLRKLLSILHWKRFFLCTWIVIINTIFSKKTRIDSFGCSFL